ncbi:hypothetical protein COLO4_36955 [Corchorus olitorius]|uniref:RNase H type-1 domain-containing protein n=1 Tax=Corchorus olitorius TaxID=93759 RepID=A0A1R3G463_9ROSI|nr:hypothetical protein COLO4_36955 [Corchorus olitorius]
MHNLNRRTRNLAEDMSCKICGWHCEDLLRTLRDRPEAKQIWQHYLGREDSIGFFTTSKEEWWKLNFLKMKKAKIGDWPWGLIFGVICWRIRKWRNEASIANTTILVSIKLEIIGKTIKEFVDVTAGTKQANEAAIGGAIRGCYGEWIMGFSQDIGKCSVDLAELWSLLQGIALAWSRNIKLLEIESNSATSINMIKKVGKNHPLFCVVEKIREYLSRDWTWKISHIPRQRVSEIGKRE